VTFPVCIARFNSSEPAITLPVETTALALPAEEPVTRATSFASSSLRDRAATPNSANFTAVA
jgi:hypothetical protein